MYIPEVWVAIMSDHLYNFFYTSAVQGIGFLKRKFDEAFVNGSSNTEEKRSKVDLELKLENLLLCKTTSWHFNCGLNCLTHFLYNKLQKNELQNLFNHHLEYNALLKTFQEYYDLPQLPTWNEIHYLLAELKVPHDREAILSPVLRKHLGKIMAAQPELMWDLEGGAVFAEYLTTGKVEDIGKPIFQVNIDYFVALKQKYDLAIQNTRHIPFTIEEDDIAKQKNQIKNKELNDENINSHIEFMRDNEIEDACLAEAKKYWLEGGGCQRYAEYLGKLENREMISADQLGLLFEKLCIRAEIIRVNQIPQKLSQQAFRWTLKIHNDEGIHWEYEEPDASIEQTKAHNQFYPTDSYYDNDDRLGKFKTYGSQDHDSILQINFIKNYVVEKFTKMQEKALTRFIPKKSTNNNFNAMIFPEISKTDTVLSYLEEIHHSHLVDLDFGDISLKAILNPWLKIDNLSSWLNNFFVENFITEKIAKSKQTDVMLITPSPDVPHLIRIFEKIAKKANDLNKILWPILEKRHFYLIMIGFDKEKNSVYIGCVDGFNNGDKQKKFLEKATHLANLLYPNADLFLPGSEKIRNQENGIDCALVDCFFASHFIKMPIREFQQWVCTQPVPKARGLETVAPYTPYRKKVAEGICDAAERILQASGKEDLISGLQKLRS